MKKVTIKGVDGKEILAYICSDHPSNFPTDMTNYTVEDIDPTLPSLTPPPNNLSELDVNENSAGCGAHEEAMKKKCCGGGCHDKDDADESAFPNMIDEKTTESEIKEWAKEKGLSAEDIEIQKVSYASPLSNAFEFGYNIETDPVNKLLKLAAEKWKEPNKLKVKLDDTIDSDLIETEDLKLGRLYRVAGVDLIVRFVGSFATTVPDGNKILLQIKHHGNLLYVEEKSLIKASHVDVMEYLNQPF